MFSHFLGLIFKYFFFFHLKSRVLLIQFFNCRSGTVWCMEGFFLVVPFSNLLFNFNISSARKQIDLFTNGQQSNETGLRDACNWFTKRLLLLLYMCKCKLKSQLDQYLYFIFFSLFSWNETRKLNQSHWSLEIRCELRGSGRICSKRSVFYYLYLKKKERKKKNVACHP